MATHAHSLTSREVSSDPVIAYAAALLADHDGLVEAGRIIPGTPAWVALDDSDPRKLHALIAGGVRDALGNEHRCAAAKQAAVSISAADDWSQIGRRVFARVGSSYIPRTRARRLATAEVRS